MEKLNTTEIENGTNFITGFNGYKMDNVRQDNKSYSKDFKAMCEYLGKEYKRIYNKELAGFNYWELSYRGVQVYDNVNRIVCFLSRKLLMRVDKGKYDFYLKKYESHPTLKSNVVIFRGYNILIIRETATYKSQSGILSRIYDTLKAPFVMLESARNSVNTVTSQVGKLFLLDLISLVLTIRNGLLTPEVFVNILIQLYTIHERFLAIFGYSLVKTEAAPARSEPAHPAPTEPERFEAQVGPTMTDLIFGFTAMGLPSQVLNAIKTFNTVTGKRIMESDILMTAGQTIFDCLTTIIKWISSPFPNTRLISEANEKYMLDIISYMGVSVFMHRDIKEVCEIYTQYVSNPQVLFDPTFREKIMTKYEKLIATPDFVDYISNGNNKYFTTTWQLFEANVVKSCRAFETAGREEPICFVFQGEAGSGKSRLATAFTDLLRQGGMTTYCHSVPAAEDGKDFYDDYENQDVFIMDDVGQQGKSQWRYLINYISPIKYPLPCAAASKKNTKFFNSKIVVITTNHFMDLTGFTSSDCISEPEALYRRAHVIKIDRGRSNHFSQVCSYYKYDHIGSKKWENKFINHCAVDVPADTQYNINTESPTDADNATKILIWLYRLYRHVVHREEANRTAMIISKEELQKILDDTDLYYDAQTFNYMKYIADSCAKLKDHVVDYYAIMSEYMEYFTVRIGGYLKKAVETVVEQMTILTPLIRQGIEYVKDFKIGIILGGILAAGLCKFLLSWFFGDVKLEQPSPEFNGNNIIDNERFGFNAGKRIKHEYFGPQGPELESDYEQWKGTVSKGCKTLVIRNTSGNDEFTQCVVSGKRILLPAHVDIGDKFVDLYQTWNHYKQKHVEIENVQLRLIKKYIISDLAVYEIRGTIPLYKLNKALFTKGATSSNNWFLINSTGNMPVVYDVNIKRNDEDVSYATVTGKWQHVPNTGFYTPYSAYGACGTVLCAPGAGLIGFHVAGGPTSGFCVEPPRFVMDEIRQFMLEAPAADFDLDSKIIPEFSGVRVRYNEPIKQMRPTGKTAYSPSVLHKDYCQDMKEMIESLETSPSQYTTTPVEVIDAKAPPNFRANGTPSQTLKHLSRKTFMPQGKVTPDEIEFMKDCIRSIMTNFTDIDDYEVAFGGTYVPPLNKDSSNGYGCETGKDNYFDFKNKQIKEQAVELFEKIRQLAKDGKYDYNYFMCRETFKDEMRKSTKVDSPRTFRVMPLGHIWWTKKIFGQLLRHFKDNRMMTGISIGFNPYTDTDALVKKLQSCSVVGDADFGKWDGTIVAPMIRLIGDVMAEHYKGEYPYMIEWLVNTIVNSFVLVNDEIWATTHGLPSGTWLTLMLNCLLNKCLTALVIYRHKPNPTVKDFHEVVDFVTGDDKVFGASGDLAKYFNLLSIKDTAESLGMDCTNGDKSKITKASQDFANLTYVKRHFRQHPVLKKYVGCLSVDTIMNTLQWVNTEASDTHEAMLGKIRSMQVEAYLHSPHFFNELTKMCNKFYPFDAFFSEEKVIKILTSEEGYEQVLRMQEKYFMY